MDFSLRHEVFDVFRDSRLTPLQHGGEHVDGMPADEATIFDDTVEAMIGGSEVDSGDSNIPWNLKAVGGQVFPG